VSIVEDYMKSVPKNPPSQTAFNQSSDQHDIPSLKELARSVNRVSPWKTVAQIAASNPAFTENALRAHIWQATPRKRSLRSREPGDFPGNGLAPAIRRVGRRLLIHEPRFHRWIETGMCVAVEENGHDAQ
jgi:hypothetical protein